VPNADDYREPADKCFEWVRMAHTRGERMMDLLARTWLQEDLRRDRAIPVRLQGASRLDRLHYGSKPA
jgi:hypothetical protein